MRIGYTSNEVCKVIGISYRQLDYWDSSGFIQPSVARARGTGTSRMYSFIDLVCLRTAKKLRDSGISLQKIRKSVDFLRTHFPELDRPLSDLLFLTDGGTVFILTRDRDTALTLCWNRANWRGLYLWADSSVSCAVRYLRWKLRKRKRKKQITCLKWLLKKMVTDSTLIALP